VAPDLDLREIVAIDIVARTRSIKIAAGLVNTTQPTLSRLIASAERTLDTPLFRRGWSGAETTPAGDAAARVCRSAIAAIDNAEQAIFADRKGLPSLRLNLRSAHLQAIEAVTREGSVTLAAKRLGRSQPELSRTISDFSKRFDIELFERKSGGMTPLAPANDLTALSGTITYLLDRLPEQLRQLEGDILGRVSVGMLPFSGQDLFSRAFARLTNLHPNIRLACVPGSYNGLVEALRRREIDRIVGVLRGSACPEGLDETHLYDERFTVVASRDHPLQNVGENLAELAATKWVVAPHGTPVRAHFEAVFAALDLTPPTQTCEMLSFGAAEQMLVESRSVAMLTYGERRLRTLRQELREVRTPFPAASAPIGITRLRNAPQDAALAEFETVLAALVAEEA
jgi:DNA-binding transcriptional LysR family regulator